MSIAYNRTILVGRVTREPETKFLTNGTQLSTFGLAVDRNFKSQTGESTVDFINITAFGKRAEFAAAYLKKGMLILIEGSLRINRWKTEKGESRSATTVSADNIRFMETKREAEESISRAGGDPNVSDETGEGNWREGGGDITFFGSDDNSSGSDEIPF